MQSAPAQSEDAAGDPSPRPLPHVVYVVPVLRPAGAERIVAELARRLPRTGFTTSVICLEDERETVGRELAEAGVAVTGLRTSRRRTMQCAARLAEALPRVRPLIVHAHLFHANIAARIAVARLGADGRAGVRVLSTVHVVERRWRPWQFLLDRWTARHAVAEICVSRAVARFQQRRTGLPESFFRVIENGIDLRRFAGDDADAGAEPTVSPAADGGGEGGGGGGGLHVVSVGRLDRQKDYPTLLRAWQIIHREAPAAHLTIAGDGPESARLHRLSRDLGLANVTWAGFVNNVPALLHSGDVYAQSSAWEGLPLAIVEAMASGLPAVVTDIDSLPDIVAHGRTGLVVPGARPEPLASAILDLLRNPQRARALGAAARAEAVRRFSVERMVSDYADLYRQVLGGDG